MGRIKNGTTTSRRFKWGVKFNVDVGATIGRPLFEDFTYMFFLETLCRDGRAMHAPTSITINYK